MPARPPSSGSGRYSGGQFNDPSWVPDPGKANQAARVTAAGPPKGLTPASGSGTSKERVKVAPAAKPVTQNVDGTPVPAAPPQPTSKPQQTGLPKPTLHLGGSPSISDGGGFALGLVLYAIGLNYLRHGLPGVTAWIGAKFINKVTAFPGDPLAATPQHITPGLNQPQYSIPYDGKQ